MKAFITSGVSIDPATEAGYLRKILEDDDNWLGSARKIKNVIIYGVSAIDINDNNNNRTWDTLLHKAVRRQNAELVKMLLKEGADVRIKNVHDKTPLDLARPYVGSDITWVLQEADKLQRRRQPGSSGRGAEEPKAVNRVPHIIAGIAVLAMISYIHKKFFRKKVEEDGEWEWADDEEETSESAPATSQSASQVQETGDLFAAM